MPITSVPETISMKLPASEATRIELAILVCEMYELEQTNANAKKALGRIIRDGIQNFRRNRQELPPPPTPFEVT